MRLSRLEILRLPGIRQGFSLEFGEGVNVVTGPNGSGKSSLTRAVFQLLWPGLQELSPCDLAADFEVDRRQWQAETHDGRRVAWRHEGRSTDSPQLPDRAIAPSYRLGVLDITPVTMGQDDLELARRIRREMDGGYDLFAARDDLFAPSPKLGMTESRKLRAARQEVRQIQDGYRALAVREHGLQQKRQEQQEASLASERVILLQALLKVRGYRTRLDDLRQRLEQLPAGAAAAQPQDPETLARLRADEGKARRETGEFGGRLAALQEELARLAVPDTGAGAFSLDQLEALIHELDRTDQDIDERRIQLAGLPAPGEPGAEDPEESRREPVDRTTFNRLLELHARLTELQIRQDVSASELDELAAAPVPAAWPGLVLLGTGTAALVGGLWRWWSGELGAGIDLPGAAALVSGAGLLAWGALLAGRRQRSGRSARQDRLQRQQQDLQHRQDETLAALGDLARQHDLDLDNPDLIHDLKAAAGRLELQLKADRDRAQLEGELKSLQQERRGVLDELNGLLDRVGAEPVADLAAARQARTRLNTRLNRLATLTGEISAAGATLKAAEDRLVRTREEIAALFARLQLDPQRDGDTAVTALETGRQERETLLREVRDAESRVTAQQEIISERAGLADLAELDRLDPAALQQRMDIEEARARNLEELNREIAELEAELAAARQADRQAAAAGRAENLADDLARKRDTARRMALGSALLDQVRRQSDTRSRPAVFDQAIELFSEFTGSRYSLEIGGRQGKEGFLARDNWSNRTLELHELSDGTRAQLLLAVRLGFIIRTESAFKPPLFLDDSLSSSDPERFAAVAGNLGLLAREHGRQVIFLTPDPVDVQAWNLALAEKGLPAAHTIDLGRERDLVRRAPVDRLQPAEPPSLPAPGSAAPDRYAEQIGVPALAPWDDAAAVHLYYLLSDHLDLLHTLLVRGISRLGSWRGARRRLTESGALDPDQDRLLAGRDEIWQAVLDGWRQGRNKPLLMDEVMASEAVTETMRDRVNEVLVRHRGDPRRLLEGLEAGEAAGFRKDKINLLQVYLEQEGLLDWRDPLSAENLVQQVQARLAHRVQDGHLTPEQVRRQTLVLVAFLDAAPGSDPD